MTLSKELESIRRWRLELEAAGFKRTDPNQYTRQDPWMSVTKRPRCYLLCAAGKTYRCYTSEQLKSIVVTILLTGDCPK